MTVAFVVLGEWSGMQEHAAAAAAAAAVAAGLQPAGRQLMQAHYMLASWIDRHEHVAGRGRPLPSPLNHGPVELLQDVLKLIDSPYISAKLRDDAVILLMYGASYLQDHYDETRGRASIEAFTRQHHRQCEQWNDKAQGIQTAWRTQRFHTHRLGVLSLDTASFLQPEASELMQRKALSPNDSLENLAAVPIQANEQELEKQVVKYAAELRKRVETRRRDEDDQQQKQRKDQRLQDEKRKRMMVLRKKRHENACRRWHYFTTRLLRVARDDPSLLELPVTVTVTDSSNSEKHVDRSKSMLRAFQNSAHRAFVRRFVAKAIVRGVSRVLCTFNMGRVSSRRSSSVSTISSARLQEMDTDTTTHRTSAVLRLGLLLCDLHFGVTYSRLYQRSFDRVAKQRGVRVEWQVFNCLRSQFPTKAHTRNLHGYLVAGGPNIGIAREGHTVETNDLSAQQRSNTVTRNTRHLGRWRQRLLVLLRDLHSRKQILLGGMGLGHVLLAEALGARIGMKEWEDGWSLLDPTIFVNETLGNGHYLDRRQGNGGMHGVRFLHGEFVQSFENDKSSGRHGLKSWRSPGEHNFVACFRDPFILSIDGSPECGAFVFETLGEFYDRDKAMRVTASARKTAVGEMREEDDADVTPVLMVTGPSLEEKRKRMGITDASDRIFDLFLDHFCRHIITTLATKSVVGGDSMAITGVICSSGICNVDASLRHLLGLHHINGMFLNVTASTDGHLMVTNPSTFALIVEHDKRIKDQSSKRRLSVSVASLGYPAARRNSVSRPPMLTLAMLRDHDGILRDSPSSTSLNQLSSRIVRLPLIRPDASSHSLNDVVSSPRPVQKARRLTRRTSTLSSDLFAQAVDGDGISVLTLSQTLTSAARGGASQGPTNHMPKRVFLRILDEECKQTHALVPLSKADLRILWLRLSAAIRLANLPSDQIVIVSRHSLLLESIQRKRPTWTFVKDCRRSDSSHRKRLQKVAQYAAYADIVLFDQDSLLTNSVNENDALLHSAKSFGLEVYVTPRDVAPNTMASHPDSSSPRKAHPQRKNSSSAGYSFRRLSRTMGQTVECETEYDVRVVEFMLLQLSGVDGVITSHPEVAINALERIATKNDLAMQHAEQLFRDWQAKGTAKTASPKRTSSTVDLTIDEEDPDDYVGGDSYYDSDDSIPEQELVDEMARQRAEHLDVGASAPMALTSGMGGRPVGSPATLANSPIPAVPSVPQRPLQPKNGGQVFGVGAIRRRIPTRTMSSSSGDGRGQLSSIGSLRAALQRTSSMVSPSGQLSQGESDLREEIRHAIGTSSLVATPPLASVKPRSMRQILFDPQLQ